jgi:putative component of toxin-antitoxin plasmid stabilization module
VWRRLFSRQSSSGVSVPVFCQREGINASLFRRWRSTLKDAGRGQAVVARSVPTAGVAVPFIDLGDLRPGGSRVEVRLELGAGIMLSIARS